MFIKNLSAVPAAAFAVNPRNPEDEFQHLVNLLTGVEPMNVNVDGTPNGTGLPGKTNVPRNTGLTRDPRSSLGDLQNVSKTSTDAKRFAAVPWYESDSNLVYRGTDLHLTGKKLWDAEKKVMSQKFPQAQTGILQTTGEVYWIVPVDINIGSTTKRWTFMLKYDNNHPHADDWGGSIKAIPMVPSIDELENRAKAVGCTKCSNVSMCDHVPHIWKDNKDNTLYLYTAGMPLTSNQLTENSIPSAAAVMARAVRWAYFYEIGLLDSKVWDEFCR